MSILQTSEHVDAKGWNMTDPCDVTLTFWTLHVDVWFATLDPKPEKQMTLNFSIISSKEALHGRPSTL